MDRTTTIILLSFVSLLFGALATALFIYVIVPWRRRRRAAKEAAANPPSFQTESPPEQPETASSAKRDSSLKQHSLFVIFDQPSEQSDERLTEWLREKGARYDPIKKIFLIAGQQPANPITITNAFPPGEMPDLLYGEKHAPIKGISLLVKPPLHKRRNQQMYVYVELAKEMQTHFSGTMLNAEREPTTDDTFERIIG
ncbi:hypothetical protein [Vreelandella sulfidaeris]|uniref:hypothetical protein n=1 Tax=Vreelandella sulfidaeris TaxID=115553 RepID=UPI0035EE4066|tara:strand:- start:510 stop:1103 length:594 start_codon:yes stop_codon:yes gene_type:complete